MVKIAFVVIFSLLAIWGLCELVFAIRLIFLMPKNNFNTYTLLVPDNEEALLQLNCVYERLKWCGNSYATAIIVVIDNLSEKDLSYCKEFAKDKNIFFCEFCDIKEVINII